jgi:hypothetical protein
MILSLLHSFVFIKGSKVAGTSIEMALAAICGADDIVTPLLPVDERERLRAGAACRNYAVDRVLEQGYLAVLAHADPAQLSKLRPPPQVFYNHMPLAQVEQTYPGSLDGFRIVCAERSPYAKVMSWLNMQESAGAYRRGAGMRQEGTRLAAAFDRARESGRIGAVRNIERYRSRTGALRAEVLRYETLRDDFDAFLRGLELPSLALPHAKRGLMANALDPRTVFRRDQLDAINAVYADEFDAFGYARL